MNLRPKCVVAFICMKNSFTELWSCRQKWMFSYKKNS